jgi:hypothetical protein
MVAPRSAAALSEPNLTACQNWCWKPFEITGIYGFVPLGDAPLPAPVQAASVTASAATTARVVDLGLISSPP